MPARFCHPTHYRASIALAASLSLLLGACTATKTTQADAVAAQLPQPVQEASANPDGGMDTETTIWQLVGIAKKPEKLPGPETGPGVSPVLWQAATDTLAFADFESQDPRAGLIVTKWYSPRGKPNDRLRITAFIKRGRCAPTRSSSRSNGRPAGPTASGKTPRLPPMSRIISRTIFSNRRGKSISRAYAYNNRGGSARRGIRDVTVQFPRERSQMAAALAR